jgi:1,4-dihydroxy-2-naphthoate octaprenyltransferase
MTSLRIWWQAARPKTLGAAVGPVLIGTALAARDGAAHLPAAAAALGGALLIQIGTNFCNDYGDAVRGADAVGRKGPVRATQAGLVSPRAMICATLLVFFAAALCGLYLATRGGWPIVITGALCILCGILYTAGPWPLAYVGLGDLFVLVFFGPVAVGGTYFVQAQHLTLPALLAGLAPGLLSVAILTVNNLRDIEQDRSNNKRTLAVRFGVAFARWEYAACLAGAALLPLALWIGRDCTGWVWLTSFALLPALPLLAIVFHHPDRLNPVLGKTSGILLLYSVLFACSWLL